MEALVEAAGGDDGVCRRATVVEVNTTQRPVSSAATSHCAAGGSRAISAGPLPRPG